MWWSGRPAARRCLVLLTIGCVLALALLPVASRLPNPLIADDGYFYAQIAYSLATRGRSTFDGVHTTSGYHLPWAFVLAAVSRALAVVTLEKSAHLLAYLAVAISLALATARHFFVSRSFQLCAFVLLVSNVSLTEMAIAIPVMLGLLRRATRDEDDGLRGAEPWLALLLPLIRIDLSCVPLVIAILLHPRDAPRARRLAVATLVGAAVQLATMKLMFGELVSVAATLKMGISLRDIPATLAMNTTTSASQTSLLVALLAIGVLAMVVRRDRSTRLVVLASSVFLAMHTVLSVLRGWYWVPSSLGLLFALEHALRAPSRPLGLVRAAHALVAVVTIAFVARAARAQIVYAGDQQAAAMFVSQLRTLVPRGATLFTYDNPGFLGYFSGHDVVDADGLVNDFEYARRMTHGGLAGYLDEERICYVVMPDADGRPVLDLAGLVLEETDVVRLLEVRRRVASQSDFVLYRLDAARCRP